MGVAEQVRALCVAGLRGACGLCALAMLSPATAATYFVEKNGSDSNSGTSAANAFKTVGKGLSVLGAGDTLYIKPGTYVESATISASGTVAGPITIIGDTAGTYFSHKGSVIIKKSGQTALTVNGSNVHVSGVGTGKSKVGIAWNGASGGTLSRGTISSATTDGLQVSGAALTVTNCTFANNAGEGVNIGPTSTVTMTACAAYSNKGRGVYVAAPGGSGAGATVTISKLQAYANTSDGVYNNAGALTLLNSLIYGNGGCGVYLGNKSATSLTEWNCTIARNAGDGVQQNAGTATVKNAVLAYNSGFGLKRVGGAVTHTNNVLYGNTSGGLSGTSSGTGEVTADPRFTSAIAYTLSAGSAAIDRGTSPGGLVTDDLSGTSRPQGAAYDCGCYEGVTQPLFADVSGATGFALVTTGAESDGSGLHWADVNGDGYLDCVITGSTARALINHGGTAFSSSTLAGARRQGAFLDADNDGDPDFFASCKGDVNTEALYLNDAGSFSTTGDGGMTAPTGNEAVVAADVNADGWCDLVMFSASGNYTGVNQRAGAPAFALSAPAGLNSGGSSGDGDYCSSADVNNDLYPDFFYHYGGGQLFLSNGDGTWSLDAAAGIGVVTGPAKKIGSAFGDYDNDGQVDLFVPCYDAGTAGFLWRNDAGVFTDVTLDAGLQKAAAGQRGCAWGDFDNDGYLDLYVCTRGGPNQLYRNNGDGTFTLVDLGAAVSGDFQDCCFVDYNNDGHMDIALTRQDGTNVLLKNLSTDSNYLKVRLVGAGSRATNKLAMGVRVELWDSTGATLLGRREIGAARGYGGSEPLWAQFGGVTPSSEYIVKAYFLSGTMGVTVKPSTATTTIGGTTIPQMVTIAEPPVSVRVTGWKEVEAH